MEMEKRMEQQQGYHKPEYYEYEYALRLQELNKNIPTGNNEISQTTFYMVPTLKWSWVEAELIRLYTKVGLGFWVQHIHNCGTYCNPTIQFRFFGMELGTRKICLSLEFGWGMAGIASLGFTYKFHRINNDDKSKAIIKNSKISKKSNCYETYNF